MPVSALPNMCYSCALAHMQAGKRKGPPTFRYEQISSCFIDIGESHAHGQAETYTNRRPPSI